MIITGFSVLNPCGSQPQPGYEFIPTSSTITLLEAPFALRVFTSDCSRGFVDVRVANKTVAVTATPHHLVTDLNLGLGEHEITATAATSEDGRQGRAGGRRLTVHIVEELAAEPATPDEPDDEPDNLRGDLIAAVASLKGTAEALERFSERPELVAFFGFEAK